MQKQNVFTAKSAKASAVVAGAFCIASATSIVNIGIGAGSGDAPATNNS